ncbi:MAG: hypothetical protein KH357_11870 [Clostridiales bacterium]|nr:hypothetical protein [Clostridiales bacterium]
MSIANNAVYINKAALLQENNSQIISKIMQHPEIKFSGEICKYTIKAFEITAAVINKIRFTMWVERTGYFPYNK